MKRTLLFMIVCMTVAVASASAQGRVADAKNQPSASSPKKPAQQAVIDPYDGDSWHLRGITKAAIRNCKKELKYYNEWIKANPRDRQAYCSRGEVEMHLQKYSEAKNDFDSSIKFTQVALCRAYYYRGFAEFKLGYPAPALVDCQRAIIIDPSDIAYRSLGVLYAWMRQYDKAIEAFDQAIKINPKYVDAYVRRGRVEGQTRHYKAAYDDFSMAIKLDSNYAEAYIEWANMKEDIQQFASAIADCNKAIAIDPGNPQAYINRGWEQLRLGHRDSAIADFNKAIYLAPAFALAYSCRCAAREESDDLKGALRDCDRAIKLDSTLYYGYQNRTIVKRKMGDKNGSHADHNKYFALLPRDSLRYKPLDSIDRNFLKSLPRTVFPHAKSIFSTPEPENANHFKTDLETQNLRGHVKQVFTKEVYTKQKNADTTRMHIKNYSFHFSRYNEQGYYIVSGSCQDSISGCNFRDSLAMKFNDSGKMTESVKYNLQNNTADPTLYNYDEKGKLREKVVISFRHRVKQVYRYNEQGDETGGEEIDSGIAPAKWTINYIYNDKGLKTETIYTFGSGDRTDTSIWRFSYGPDGSTTIEGSTSYPDAIPSANKYDRENRLVESKVLYDYRNRPQPWITGSMRSKYNEHNDLIEVDYYLPDGKHNSKATFVYEYDGHGNWIKQTYLVRSKPQVIKERTIEYY